ncbi:DUF2795 domain-containing protein [Polymorphospora rubra]|uniref:DUF2795 domain-containing protein n=1 Tax=Polymorphospora rubra TaxID=338584 RepID=UPI0033FAA4BC
MTSQPLPWEEQLSGLDYPVSKEDLIRRAQESGADTKTLQALRSLPADRFGSPAEVTGALGPLR